MAQVRNGQEKMKLWLSLILLLAFPAISRAQSKYPDNFELTCQAGSSPASSPGSVSYNPATGKYRANQCIDSNGIITWNGGGGGGAVSSVFGRSGAVVSAANDYNFNQLAGSAACTQLPALTGDTTTSAGSCTTAVSKINGTSMAGLATGILKNTTGTGVPSIAVAGDFPTLNQNTTGTSAGLSLPSGTATMGTAAIASGACATVVTVTATGLTTATGSFSVNFNGDPTAVTGYGVSATGAVLTIYSYPSAGNINFKVCNNTASSITPAALTLNWQVTHL